MIYRVHYTYIKMITQFTNLIIDVSKCHGLTFVLRIRKYQNKNKLEILRYHVI